MVIYDDYQKVLLMIVKLDFITEPKQDNCPHLCNWMSWISNFLLETTQDHLGLSKMIIESTWIEQRRPLLSPWKFNQFQDWKIMTFCFCSRRVIFSPILTCNTNLERFFWWLMGNESEIGIGQLILEEWPPQGSPFWVSELNDTRVWGYGFFCWNPLKSSPTLIFCTKIS